MEKQLPKNWIECTMNELAEITAGIGFPNHLQGNLNGEIPFYKVGDISQSILRNEIYLNNANNYISEEVRKELKGKLFPKGTLVFAKIGEALRLNRRAIISKPSLCDNNVMGIMPNHMEMYKLIYYYFCTLDLGDFSAGNSIPSIRKSSVLGIPFPLPPLAEQNRLVTKLDKLFTQLEIIKTSMANIPLLLKDFRQQVLTQAVTGKLTNCNVKEKRLGDLLIDVKYGTSMKSEYEIDGTPIFRIPNINDGEINDLDLKYSILNDKEYNQLKLIEGDVLIIRSNGSVTLVGRSAIIRKKHEGFSYAGYLIRLRCGEELNSEFLNYSLKSDFLRSQIVSTSHSSSGVNNINSQEIKDLKIYWAQPKEQLEIVKCIDILFTKADAIEQQYQSLKQKIDTLPQALLHKAFKGELTEQLESDGDARELLKEIQELKNSAVKPKKFTATKKKNYPEKKEVLGIEAEG